MGIEDKFNFGKHKGDTLEYVLKFDPSYVEWCLGNIKFFSIEPKSLEKKFLKERQTKHYYDCGYDEYYAEMDFCMGLSGGAQGW